MARKKSKIKTQARSRLSETDSVYFLKLVIYMIIGSLWIKVTTVDAQVPVPAGFLVGLLFTAHEHFKVDRKIEYAVLLVAALVGFWAPIGLYITLQ